ncbi:MAG: S-layer homology domain-containing protein [Oscillospiraceae bacterium]|nr:S-layer homology domain-containing protein [Oscillospiraceae bacterium]
MKRRIRSIITALALCLSLLPAPARAVDETLTRPLDFTNIGEGEGQTPAEGPGYKLEGNDQIGYTLTLDGLSLNATEYTDDWEWRERTAILLPADGPVTVVLKGKNTISASSAWNDERAIYAKSTFDLTVEGTGELETNVNNEPIYLGMPSVSGSDSGNMTIRGVTIRGETRGGGVFCNKGNITIENAAVMITTQGTNNCAIQTLGDIVIKDSDVNISCAEYPGINGGNISITGGTFTASGGIYNGVQYPAINCAKLTVNGLAVIEPVGGTIGEATILNSDGSAAASVKLSSVTLNVPTNPPTCTYGDTDTVKVTLTTTPATTSTVEVYNGTAKVGEGMLNEEITIDTSNLSVGDATLTAKLPDDLGEKDFTIKVNPKALTVIGAAATSRAYDKTDKVEITDVMLDGIIYSDTVSVDTTALTGILNGSNAGNYTAVTLPTLTLTGAKAGNYTLVQPAGAVETSVSITKADYSGTTTVSTSGKYGREKTCDLSDLLPEGYMLGTPTKTDTNSIFDGNPTVDGATLTYKLADNAEIGKAGTITVPVTNSTNYKPFELTITVTVTDKIVPALTISPISAAYTGSAVPASAIQGMATAEGKTIPGTWSFADGQALTNVADSGMKTVFFTPADEAKADYTTATGTVHVTITKATPSLTLTPSSAILPNGGTVALTLSGLPAGGSANVTCSEASITVTKGSGNTWTAELPAGGTSYTFTATYTGDGNHNGATADCTVSLDKIRPTLSLTADSNSLIGGGMVTLILSGLPADGTATVTCSGGITVTAGAGNTWTAALPNSTAVYTFTASYAGNASYYEASAEYTVRTTEVVILPNPPADDGGMKFQLVMETGISEIPAGLKGIESLNTPEKLETAMRTEITQVTPGIPQANTAVYNVALMVSTDGGTTWTPATKDNLPAGGLTVTLPYPHGTNSSYCFTVVHMFTSSDFGKTPGDTEVFTSDQVKNTSQGLQVVVTGLSPLSVGWTAPATNPDTSSSGNHGGGGSSSTYAITIEKLEHGKVISNRTNASSGSTITLTVTPDSGYVLDALTVTDSRGNEIKLTAQDGGKYTFTMPSRAVTVKAAFAPLPDDTQKPCDGGMDCPSRGFTDLEGVGTWYHEAVDYVLRNGLMGGYGNGLFGPNDHLSRAQFAQILFNKEGRPVVNYLLQYGDVAEDASWYTEAVRWATSQGIVGGYGNGMFGPNDNITREQLAVMLWRYVGSPAAANKKLHFTDAGKASGYALEALRWAVENGIINGKGGGILDPKGLATRAQVAQILKNFMGTQEIGT